MRTHLFPRAMTLWVMAIVALNASPSHAQDKPISPTTIQSTPTPQPTSGFYYDSYTRNRFEYTDWSAPVQYDRTARFDTLKGQLGGGYRDSRFEAYAQGQLFGGFHIPDNATGTGGAFYLANQDQDFVNFGYRQAHVTLKQTESVPLSAKVGRFLYSSGEEVAVQDPNLSWLVAQRVAQRLIGVSDYNIGRSFNGVRLDRNDGHNTATFTFSNPSQGVNQANINPTIYDVDIATAAYTYADTSTVGQAFAYYYGDGRGTVPVDNRPLDIRTLDTSFINIYTFGGSAVKVFDNGGGEYLDTVLWGAGQAGNYGDLDHKAAAAVVEAGYQYRSLPWQPWIRAGWNYTTGDHSSTDGSHTTFSQLIPTARRYAQTPFYNMQNMNDLFVQGILNPVTPLKIRTDVHYLQLSSNQDLIYAGAGPNDKTHFGMAGLPSGGSYNVGILLDTDISYQFTKALSTGVYVGHLFPSGVIDNNYPSGRRNITYAFWDVIYKF